LVLGQAGQRAGAVVPAGAMNALPGLCPGPTWRSWVVSTAHRGS